MKKKMILVPQNNKKETRKFLEKTLKDRVVTMFYLDLEKMGITRKDISAIKHIEFMKRNGRDLVGIDLQVVKFEKDKIRAWDSNCYRTNSALPIPCDIEYLHIYGIDSIYPK